MFKTPIDDWNRKYCANLGHPFPFPQTKSHASQLAVSNSGPRDITSNGYITLHIILRGVV